jgi:hypothetical protein
MMMTARPWEASEEYKAAAADFVDHVQKIRDNHISVVGADQAVCYAKRARLMAAWGAMGNVLRQLTRGGQAPPEEHRKFLSQPLDIPTLDTVHCSRDIVATMKFSAQKIEMTLAEIHGFGERGPAALGYCLEVVVSRANDMVRSSRATVRVLRDISRRSGMDTRLRDMIGTAAVATAEMCKGVLHWTLAAQGHTRARGAANAPLIEELCGIMRTHLAAFQRALDGEYDHYPVPRRGEAPLCIKVEQDPGVVKEEERETYGLC